MVLQKSTRNCSSRESLIMHTVGSTLTDHDSEAQNWIFIDIYIFF